MDKKKGGTKSKPQGGFRAPARRKASKSRERADSVEVVDLHDATRRSLDLVEPRASVPFRSGTTTPGLRSQTPGRKSLGGSGRSSMDSRRSTASRLSEDRRLPRRVTSIDTTCIGAAPDGSGRPSKSIDLTPEELADQWTAKIVESFDLCGQIRYILQVRAPPRKWLIRRSFKDFQHLNQALRKRFGDSGFPALPPNSHNIFGPSAAFLENRLKGLQHYIDTVAASRAMIRNCRICREFIQPPKLSDRTTFLINPNAPPLPTDFPDLPAEDTWPKDRVPLEMRRTIGDLVNKAAVSLRRLYIFEQTLETDKSCERQCITFDQERNHVATSLQELSEFMPQLEALCHDHVVRGWKDLAQFVTECARVCGQAIAWGRNFDMEEAHVIRKFLHLRDSVPVRPVSYYEDRAAQMASEVADFASVMLQSHPPFYVAELFSQIEREMEIRSDAQQASSVNRLFTLLDLLKSGRYLKTVSDTRRETPLQTIVDALVKRAEFLRHSVNSFVSHPDLTSLDRTGLVYQIEQLANDIDHASGRVEHYMRHPHNNGDNGEKEQKEKAPHDGHERKEHGHREKNVHDDHEKKKDGDGHEKDQKMKKEDTQQILLKACSSAVLMRSSATLNVNMHELETMDETLERLDGEVESMLQVLENAPDNGAADSVLVFTPVVYDDANDDDDPHAVELHDLDDVVVVDVIPEPEK